MPVSRLTIDISSIVVNKQGIDEDQVYLFVDRLEQNLFVPPITVRKASSGYILVDGRHRLAAHKELGRSHISARITP